ncbi:MAG TPA: biotin-dependent carboxyltransferase family protein [Devosiaceae bacterium]|nr:biotin-dependent carboxyltransferase family protein [Devosiaceae bacterium]
MSVALEIFRAGPLASIQDAGRFGYLRHGISASGPMDRGAFAAACAGAGGASEAIEFSQAGLGFRLAGGSVTAAFAGGAFILRVNQRELPWPGTVTLADGDEIEVTPGPAGNYGYAAFHAEIDVPPVLSSRATNLVAGLGGFAGRALRAGDVLTLGAVRDGRTANTQTAAPAAPAGPVRFVWGIHAEIFSPALREAFVSRPFRISQRLDRMGVRLDDVEGVFAETTVLSLVSDAVVAGDIQILGDGTPIVLMRDHQPTGGYPRIGTVIDADLDRFAQMRPGTTLAFAPVTLQKARELFLASRA